MQGNLENLIASKFIARSDVKAVQQEDGAYFPDRHPITRADLSAHVAGTRTFGHYQLGLDSKCKFVCFDLDWRKPNAKVDPPVQPWYENEIDQRIDYNPREAWLDAAHPNRTWMTIKMRTLAEALALKASREFLYGTAILYSGCKGFHVYIFFDDPQPADDARILAHEILESFGKFERFKGENFWRHTNLEGGYRDIEIEVFPKQDSLDGKDLGNLLRMPLGVNRKTMQSSFFVDVNTGYDTLQAVDPVEALTYLNPWGGPAPESVSMDV